MVRMWQWKKEMIYYMKNASQESKYYEQLAEIISPYLGVEDLCCDAGCGLGQLSIAISPYVKEVFAFDINQDALGVLEENMKKHKIPNITPKQVDIFSYHPKEKFDSMIFCMCGNVRKIISTAERSCQGKLIIIKRIDQIHKFAIKNKEKSVGDFSFLEKVLAESSIPYHSETFTLHLDQPFKNLKEAKEFFILYGKAENESEISEDFLQSRVKKQNDNQYPYILTNSRNLGLIVLESKYLKSLLATDLFI